MTTERQTVRVGIAEYRVARAPAMMVTYGVGSCVAVALWDPEEKIGGLAHVMLPADIGVKKVTNPLKYADFALKEMIREIEELGGIRERLEAKIAGGARMFDTGEQDDRRDVGARNVRSVLKILLREGIPLKGQDTGGAHGRSIEFLIDDGTLTVRAIKCGVTSL